MHSSADSLLDVSVCTYKYRSRKVISNSITDIMWRYAGSRKLFPSAEQLSATAYMPSDLQVRWQLSVSEPKFGEYATLSYTFVQFLERFCLTTQRGQLAMVCKLAVWQYTCSSWGHSVKNVAVNVKLVIELLVHRTISTRHSVDRTSEIALTSAREVKFKISRTCSASKREQGSIEWKQEENEKKWDVHEGWYPELQQTV